MAESAKEEGRARRGWLVGMSDAENICKACLRQINPSDESPYFHSLRQREICRDSLILKLYKEALKA